MRPTYVRCAWTLIIVSIAMFATTYINDYGGRADMYNGTLIPSDNNSIHYYQYYQNREYEFKLVTDSKYPLTIEVIDSKRSILFSDTVSTGQKFYLRPATRGYVDVMVTLTHEEEVGFNLSYTMEDAIDKDVQRDILIFMIIVAIIFVIVLVVPDRRRRGW